MHLRALVCCGLPAQTPSFGTQSFCPSSKVAGGVDLIQKIEANLLSGTSCQRLVWVDALAYDAWPALSCMTKKTVPTFCATIAHCTPKKRNDYLQQLIMNSAYEKARSGEVEIDGFPQFAPLIQDMKALETQAAGGDIQAEFKVCTVIQGALVIKQAYMDKFSAMPGFAEKLENHNDLYNQGKLQAADAKVEGEPAKKENVGKVTDCILVESLEDMTSEKLASLPNPLLGIDLVFVNLLLHFVTLHSIKACPADHERGHAGG